MVVRAGPSPNKWTNETLYNGLPKVTDKIKARRLRLAGHCVRHGMKEDADSASVEVAGSLVLWEPTQGKRRVGGQHCTYVKGAQVRLQCPV